MLVLGDSGPISTVTTVLFVVFFGVRVRGIKVFYGTGCLAAFRESAHVRLLVTSRDRKGGIMIKYPVGAGRTVDLTTYKRKYQPLGSV